MSKRILRTRLCDMLGIDYPILSAGMGPTLMGEETGAPVEYARCVPWQTITVVHLCSVTED